MKQACMDACACIMTSVSQPGSLLRCPALGTTLGHSLPYCVEGLQGGMSVSVQVYTNGVSAMCHESIAVCSTACAWRGCCTDSLQAESALSVSQLPLPPLHMLWCQVGDLMTSQVAHQSSQKLYLQPPCLNALHRDCGELGSRPVL